MTLDSALFSLLGIYNGPWVYSPSGTDNSDDITGLAEIIIDGRRGNDRITGNNFLVQNIRGGDGSDQIYGKGGQDNIQGGSDNDLVEGGAGGSNLIPISTRERLSGSRGIDTLSYESSNAAVTVNMSVLTGGGYVTVSGGHAQYDDVINDFENVVGSAHNDTITGNASANILIGLGGNDTLNGMGGNDTLVGDAGADILNGGAGVDTLSYESSGAAVTVDMSTLTNGYVTVSGGHAQSDTVINDFENVAGTAYNDTITGNAGDNILIGRGGNDTLNGGDGDDTLNGGADSDTLNGGSGSDTADYSGSTRVVLDLTRGGGSAGEANGDSYQSIENIVGSTAGDTIYGDGGSNRIDGGSGNDEIRGYLGNDIITGGLGSDVLYGDFPINFPPPWPDSDDKFRYTSLAEILSNDTIKDFGESDFIDLSEADADPVTSGRQAFHFGPGVGQIEIINGNHVQVTGQSGGIDVGFKNNGELVADDFIF